MEPHGQSRFSRFAPLEIENCKVQNLNLKTFLKP